MMKRSVGRMEPSTAITDGWYCPNISLSSPECLFSPTHVQLSQAGVTASGNGVNPQIREKEFFVFPVSKIDVLGELESLDNVTARSERALSRYRKKFQDSWKMKAGNRWCMPAVSESGNKRNVAAGLR